MLVITIVAAYKRTRTAISFRLNKIGRIVSNCNSLVVVLICEIIY